MPQSWARLGPSKRREKYARRARTYRKGEVSIGTVRDEGVFEVGSVGSILFVVEERVHLFHAQQVAQVMA